MTFHSIKKNTPSHFADGDNHSSSHLLRYFSLFRLRSTSSALLRTPDSGDHLLWPPLETILLDGERFTDRWFVLVRFKISAIARMLDLKPLPPPQ
ncbi:hypothetical protein RHSIM_Rhsim05G0017900 [Rhododendron simsii]|uniref:Uncharacterized protein n=1 Tax=Rhododendron simsii TaxID=118357 RepID=A0A834GZU8_RHOSS|nr:hypothetical protein RHSIM_Rhsim05G0017900 [Rhododendron simsii]